VKPAGRLRLWPATGCGLRSALAIWLSENAAGLLAGPVVGAGPGLAAALELGAAGAALAAGLAEIFAADGAGVRAALAGAAGLLWAGAGDAAEAAGLIPALRLELPGVTGAEADPQAAPRAVNRTRPSGVQRPAAGRLTPSPACRRPALDCPA